MHNINARLIKLELHSFKNVNEGEITFMNHGIATNHKELILGDVVGIYGSNGSGKTAAVEALHILQCIFRGKKIPSGQYMDIIDEGGATRLGCSFYVNTKELGTDETLLVDYQVNFHHIKAKNKICVQSEKLSYKTWGSSWKGERTLSVINPYVNSENVLESEHATFECNIKDFNNISFASSADRLALLSLEQGGSILFNPVTVNETDKYSPNQVGNLSIDSRYMLGVISGIHLFSLVNFQIIRENMLGIININTFLPLMMYKRGESFIGSWEISIQMGENNIIDKNDFGPLEESIDEINTALKGLISNLELSIEKKDEIVKDDKEFVAAEFYAIRNGKRFSLKNESMGIKRIISMLAYMIAAFNNSEFCLVVDELDDGMFEFLLGELIGIMGKEAKGQLIFTSHNLRVLEKLPYKNIICTTVNPDRRYIRLRGVAANNNKRDFYLRALMVGGQDEELYDLKELEDIGGAFRAAYPLNASESNNAKLESFKNELSDQISKL